MKKTTFKRFAFAIGGSAGVAFSAMLLSLSVMGTSETRIFGTYSLIQVLIGFGYGISNALFGSIYLIEVNRTSSEADIDEISKSYQKANLIYCAIASLSVLVVAEMAGLEVSECAILGISAILLWYRWFGRGVRNALHRTSEVAKSDFTVTMSTCVLLGALFFLNELQFEYIIAVQLISAALGIIALGAKYNSDVLAALIHGSTKIFVRGFKDKGRYSLSGVVTTEATTNSHAYLTSAILGPAAFAPIAAAALFFRPIPVVLMSLTQLERPKLARFLQENKMDDVYSLLKNFKIVVSSFWVIIVIIAYFALIWITPHLSTSGYSHSDLVLAAVFWAIIMGVRCVRVPESALIQSAGRFKDLAKVTLLSAIVAVPMVSIMVFNYGAVWSLSGVLLAEMTATILTIKLASGIRQRGING